MGTHCQSNSYEEALMKKEKKTVKEIYADYFFKHNVVDDIIVLENNKSHLLLYNLKKDTVTEIIIYNNHNYIRTNEYTYKRPELFAYRKDSPKFIVSPHCHECILAIFKYKVKQLGIKAKIYTEKITFRNRFRNSCTRPYYIIEVPDKADLAMFIIHFSETMFSKKQLYRFS